MELYYDQRGLVIGDRTRITEIHISDGKMLKATMPFVADKKLCGTQWADTWVCPYASQYALEGTR